MMKTLRKTITVLLLMLLSINVIAGSKPLDSIIYVFKMSANNKMAVMVLDQMNGKSVDLILSKQNGEVVQHQHFEHIDKSTAAFDFSEMDAGHYVLLLQSEDSRIVRDIEITPQQTAILGNLHVASDAPYDFKLKDKELTLYLKKSADKVLKVSLYNLEGEEVFRSRFVKDFKPVKQLDLRQLPSGIYMLRMKGEETDVTETIVL